MKKESTMFWDVTMRTLAEAYGRFGGTQSLLIALFTVFSFGLLPQSYAWKWKQYISSKRR
jgi:hypothetical protein